MISITELSNSNSSPASLSFPDGSSYKLGAQSSLYLSETQEQKIPKDSSLALLVSIQVDGLNSQNSVYYQSSDSYNTFICQNPTTKAKISYKLASHYKKVKLTAPLKDGLIQIGTVDIGSDNLWARIRKFLMAFFSLKWLFPRKRG